MRKNKKQKEFEEIVEIQTKLKNLKYVERLNYLITLCAKLLVQERKSKDGSWSTNPVLTQTFLGRDEIDTDFVLEFRREIVGGYTLTTVRIYTNTNEDGLRCLGTYELDVKSLYYAFNYEFKKLLIRLERWHSNEYNNVG